MSVKIKTKPFGEIEVDEGLIIDFPEGIFGFDFIKKFVILYTDYKKSPFSWLQAYDEPDLAFVIICPVDILGEYNLVISQSDMEAVESDKVEDLLVFSIVTIPNNTAEMTANLQGPVIINLGKKLGRQVISLSDKYTVRHMILDEINKLAGKKG